MRRLKSLFAALLILPLAACFDAEMALDFTNEDDITMVATMNMSPDLFQMMSGMGQDPCADADGVGTANPDGTYSCTMSHSGTLDEIIEMSNNAAQNGTPFSQESGTTVERRGDAIFVSFDLARMMEDMPPAEERAQMSMMFGDAFRGKAITINVMADTIIETNGTLMDDGKTAQFVIDLAAMFSPNLPDLPDSFDILMAAQ
ncbi:MAG: hypothetical protein ACRBCL_15560 [Maritimibacter sp.]